MVSCFECTVSRSNSLNVVLVNEEVCSYEILLVWPVKLVRVLIVLVCLFICMNLVVFMIRSRMGSFGLALIIGCSDCSRFLRLWLL